LLGREVCIQRFAVDVRAEGVVMLVCAWLEDGTMLIRVMNWSEFPVMRTTFYVFEPTPSISTPSKVQIFASVTQNLPCPQCPPSHVGARVPGVLPMAPTCRCTLEHRKSMFPSFSGLSSWDDWMSRYVALTAPGAVGNVTSSEFRIHHGVSGALLHREVNIMRQSVSMPDSMAVRSAGYAVFNKLPSVVFSSRNPFLSLTGSGSHEHAGQAPDESLYNPFEAFDRLHEEDDRQSYTSAQSNASTASEIVSLFTSKAIKDNASSHNQEEQVQVNIPGLAPGPGGVLPSGALGAMSKPSRKRKPGFKFDLGTIPENEVIGAEENQFLDRALDSSVDASKRRRASNDPSLAFEEELDRKSMQILDDVVHAIAQDSTSNAAADEAFNTFSSSLSRGNAASDDKENQGSQKKKSSSKDESMVITEYEANGKRKFGCKICGSKLTKKADVHRHIRAVHQKTRTLSCPECNSQFQEKWHLTNHVRSVHRQLKPFNCDMCDRSFGAVSDFKKHLRRVHNKEHRDIQELLKDGLQHGLVRATNDM